MARYLTTTLPYVNADPHIGFALELVQADAYARALRARGEEVFFNTGVDEHGSKVYLKAQEAGESPQAYVDRYAARYVPLKDALNLSYDRFIRTTNPVHEAAAAEFWHRCATAGDIYKKAYRIKYCVGCELEKTDSELVDGRCPIHPHLEIELREEENYFFRLSAYQDRLIAFYREHADFMIPAFRLNELTSLIEHEGLQDFSISRVAEKMPWGIPVPGDASQVMYVWFDALVNYISTLGWPDDSGQFEKFWANGQPVQFAGKDQVRQQAAMWQAMLMSAGLPPTRQIFIHGFVTSEGQKMSKSLGNTVNPLEYVERYGTDAVRYFLLRHMHPFEDSDFTRARFEESYTAHLTNGLGNLVARSMKLAETHLPAPITVPENATLPKEYQSMLDSYEFNRAMDAIWSGIQELDARINRDEPFKLIKTEPERARALITELVLGLYGVGQLLAPFLPATSVAILSAVRANKKPENLFPRI